MVEQVSLKLLASFMWEALDTERKGDKLQAGSEISIRF